MATYDAGVVTAYGAAVQGGYTGTYEEFCAQLAEYATLSADVTAIQGDIGDLSELETTAKSDLVSAINEAAQSGGGGGNVSSVNGQTGAVVLDAGDLEYDDSETYAAGSVGAELTSLMGDLSDMDDRVTALEQGGGSGLTSDIKQALLQLAAKVAYVDDDGQDYYDDLRDALYPIVSISATYTQSGTVYNTTSLNDLKSDLVVTALLTDGTTMTVPSNEYTLSGSLVTGTSTITVTYVGKTTTFTVTVTADSVSSISAVYTQTDVVIVTDSIDSLKTDLVVTASWASGATSTVDGTDYTLSGTLSGGTSTITATYNGKTDSFSVTVTAPPSGYTAYQAISFTGSSGTKYTNRNVLMPTKTYTNLNRVSLDFVFKANTNTGDCIFGGRTASGSGSSFAFYINGTTLSCHVHGNDLVVSNPASADINRVIYTATTATPSTISVNGASSDIAWSNDNTINTFMSLFTNQQTSVSTIYLKPNIKVGRIIVKDTDGDIIQIYIPCKRTSDNVVGLYDTVEDQFYTTGNSTYSTVGGSGCVYSVGDWT